MLNCRQVHQQADRLLAHELAPMARLRLRLHLVMCRHCRRFVRQLEHLIAASPTLHGRADDAEVAAIMTILTDGNHQRVD